MSTTSRSTAIGVATVAVGAGLWGTDALFRRGLALDAAAASVVFWEHALLALVLAIPIWRRRHTLAGLSRADWASLLLIGVGASALATLAFTRALSTGDPTTPLLLQKIQPLVAIVGARVILGERPRARLALFVVPALAGAYLITFAEPTVIVPRTLEAGALGVAAATLWALGTVLGRRMTGVLDTTTLTGLRFAIGLPAAAVVVLATGATVVPSGGAMPAIVGLSLVPGLAALLLYYRGLRNAPASLATLAELAFPVVAIIIGRVAFDATLTVTQVIGVLLLTGSVTALSLVGRRGPEAAGVELAPEPRSAVPTVTAGAPA